MTVLAVHSFEDQMKRSVAVGDATLSIHGATGISRQPCNS